MRPELLQATELLKRDTPESLEQAIGLLQRTVYSFSMKVCGHPEDAEDTTQEVLSRSLRHLVKISEPKALAVWLYTVTRNRCWRMRRKDARVAGKIFSLDELMPDDAELARMLQDASAGPEGNLLQAERHYQVHEAVLKIPPQLRIVLVLHDMEELSTDQVAQILGLQQGTVRVRLHRARLTLRKEMARGLNATSQPNGKAKGARKSKKQIDAASTRRPDACREIFANLSEYLDNRVEPRSCEQMRRHIEACPACVVFLQDLRHAIDRCRAAEISCDASVASRLQALLTQEYLRMLTQSG